MPKLTYRAEFTGLNTCSAFGAFFPVDPGHLFLFPNNGVGRTRLETGATHLAFVSHDLEVYEFRTDQGWTMLVPDVSIIFIPEISNC